MTTIPEKQFVEIFSTRLAYLERGQGPSIVCLHGALDCSDTFAPLIEAIDFARVVAFDLPGCGDSSLPKDPFGSLATMARYLAEALEKQDLTQVFLVGHGQGAALCVLLASFDPERVKGLCLLGSSFTEVGSEGLLRASRVWPLRWMSRYTFGARMLRWRLNAQMLTKASPERALRLANYWREGRRAKLSWLQKLPMEEQEALTDKLKMIEVPVLLIHGERDRFISREQAQHQQAECKQARLEIVLASAHYPHEEKPLEVAQLLRDWLKIPDSPEALSTDDFAIEE